MDQINHRIIALSHCVTIAGTLLYLFTTLNLEFEGCFFYKLILSSCTFRQSMMLYSLYRFNIKDKYEESFLRTSISLLNTLVASSSFQMLVQTAIIACTVSTSQSVWKVVPFFIDSVLKLMDSIAFRKWMVCLAPLIGILLEIALYADLLNVFIIAYQDVYSVEEEEDKFKGSVILLCHSANWMLKIKYRERHRPVFSAVKEIISNFIINEWYQFICTVANPSNMTTEETQKEFIDCNASLFFKTCKSVGSWCASAKELFSNGQ